MRVLFFDSNEVLTHLLPNGFRQAGHVVQVSGPLQKGDVPRLIQTFRPQLIVTNGWGPEQTLEKQDEIRTFAKLAGIPQIYWSVEDPISTDTFVLPLLQRLQPDFVFTISESTVRRFQALGYRAAHLDFGYEPSIHRHIHRLQEYRVQIALVANSYSWDLGNHKDPYRVKSMHDLLLPLVQHNIRVDIWGHSWDSVHPFLGCGIPADWLHGPFPYLDTFKIYSSAKITLGFQNLPDQLTHRTYEILACQGFLLTSDTPAIRAHFQPGRDLVVSSSPEQTVDLVRYYLDPEHRPDRRQIRRQGVASVTPHSYQNRAEQILRVLQSAGILGRI